MTDRIELSWDVPYAVDEQRYYCSETPIDVNNLPTPKAVLTGDTRTYTDTAIESGKKYYVAVGSVKNGVEKVSQEVEIFAGRDPHWDKVVALLHFDDEEDPWKDEKGKVWTPVGIVESTPGKWGKSAGSFVSTNDKYLRCPNTDGIFNLPGQFTFECWFQHTNSKNPYRNIFLGGSSSFSGGFAVTVGDKSSISVAEMYGQNILTAPFTVGDGWYFLAVTRDVSNTIRLFIDGILISQTVSTSPFSFSSSGHAHILNHPDGSGSVGRIDELRITKGVARYTESFTPPDAPFLNY